MTQSRVTKKMVKKRKCKRQEQDSMQTLLPDDQMPKPSELQAGVTVTELEPT